MSKPWYRNFQFFAAVVFIVIIAAIWFGGPHMGMVSAETRFAWIFALMLLWIGSLMVGRLLAERSARVFERILRRRADEAVIGASPEKRAEVALLRQRLLGAIDTLKRSRIGKTRGRAALYELPWYLVIGHPSAGKSTAILNSGLTFPLAGKGQVAVQGVGGTRNCDWFFATEGVMLDTAGRYSTQTEDRAEWLEFLKMLRKHRPKAPVNGVLVTLSFPELIHFRSESFMQYARSVRQRLNELENAFGMKVPVYLLVTKMDLLPGFADFFGHLTEEERRQAWGASLPHEQALGFDAVRAVGQHMDALVAGLGEMGRGLAASHRVHAERAALHAFPLEFRSLKDCVSRFVEHLVEKDPYHTQPLLRGIYFTSAIQGGKAGWPLGHRVAQHFDLDRQGLDGEGAPGSQSFFLQDLFHSAIFPDQYLVGRQGGLRRHPRRLAGLAAGLLGLAVTLGLWSWSLVGNRALIREAREEHLAANRLAASPNLEDRLKGIQVIQLRLEQLYAYRQGGRPTRLGWGLYKGRDLERTLREEYFRQLRPLLLQPVKTALENRLREAAHPAPSAPLSKGSVHVTGRGSSIQVTSEGKPAASSSQEVEASYNALKTYLMLRHRERMETALLSDQLPKFWRPWLKEQGVDPSHPDIQRMAERTIAFYTSQVAEPDLPLIDNDEALVADARGLLRGAIQTLSPLERIYGELKARANTQFSPMTVGRVLENRDLDVVAGSHAVQGCFTRDAWDKYLRAAIEEAARGGMKGSDWVLAAPMDEGLAGANQEANQEKLEALYKAEYTREWQRFLEGIVVRDYAGIEAAGGAVGRLADPKTSPLKLILAKAAYETAWDNPSELNRTLTGVKAGVVARAEQILGTGNSQGGPASGHGEVGGRFAGVATLVQGPSGSRVPIDGYLDLLRKVQVRLTNVAGQGEGGEGARLLMQATVSGSGSELAECQQYVDSVMLPGLDESSRQSVRGLLLRPLTQAFATLVPEVEREVNRLWTRNVLKAWSGLEDKYPFVDSANDAPLTEVVRFLKPGEGPVDQFVDKVLGPLVVRRSGQVSARTWGNQGLRFNPAFFASVSRLNQVAEAVLDEGENCRFELQPGTTIGVQEIQLEVDGQKLLYRNGLQAWNGFLWPGAGAQGVRLQVVSNTGAVAQVLNAPGRLGLLRVLDQARKEGTGSTFTLEWRFKAARAFTAKGSKESGEEAYPHPIRINFRMVSGPNPMKLGALRHQSLPAKVTL